MGGHAGVLRTFPGLSAIFYQPKSAKMSKCWTCQQIKMSTLGPSRYALTSFYSEGVFEHLALIVDLLPSHGFTTILVIVDKLNMVILGIASNDTAAMVAQLFVTRW